jgi:hypothetical protein
VDARGGVKAAAVALFSACWVLFFLHLLGWVSLPDRVSLSLYAFYSATSAIGWLAGMVYVQSTRHLFGTPRRWLFLLTFFGPPSLVFLLRAMAPEPAQHAAPLVPVWALGVFGLFFYVPVSFRHAGRGGGAGGNGSPRS